MIFLKYSIDLHKVFNMSYLYKSIDDVPYTIDSLRELTKELIEDVSSKGMVMYKIDDKDSVETDNYVILDTSGEFSYDKYVGINIFSYYKIPKVEIYKLKLYLIGNYNIDLDKLSIRSEPVIKYGKLYNINIRKPMDKLTVNGYTPSANLVFIDDKLTDEEIYDINIVHNTTILYRLHSFYMVLIPKGRNVNKYSIRINIHIPDLEYNGNSIYSESVKTLITSRVNIIKIRGELKSIFNTSGIELSFG